MKIAALGCKATPLRVAHIIGKMVGGGIESVVMNYYRHIDRDRVQFCLLVDPNSTLVPVDEFKSLGGRIIEIPPYQNQPANTKELKRLSRKERWQIVHSHVNALSVFLLRTAKRAEASYLWQMASGSEYDYASGKRLQLEFSYVRDARVFLDRKLYLWTLGVIARETGR